MASSKRGQCPNEQDKPSPPEPEIEASPDEDMATAPTLTETDIDSFAADKTAHLHYISGITKELQIIADQMGEPFLAYLLDMATIEASAKADHLNNIPRSGADND
ncbi:MAG: hypothetical protein DHS20C08_03870 [Rhodomicrobium sp.]|nr:MAG: hypothetical protein DHS20C08_03870 [Rhodomicrobium sp.]